MDIYAWLFPPEAEHAAYLISSHSGKLLELLTVYIITLHVALSYRN